MNFASKLWTAVVPTNPKLVRSGQTVTIKVPEKDSINYASARDFYPLNRARSITLSGVIVFPEQEEVVAVDRNGGEGLEPNFRPMLYRSMHGQNNRWWSSTGVPIAPGDFSITVPLDPAWWSNVYGKSGDSTDVNRRGFKRTLNSCQPSITFGGGNNYGHGVRSLTGNIFIHVRQYTIK